MSSRVCAACKLPLLLPACCPAFGAIVTAWCATWATGTGDLKVMQFHVPWLQGPASSGRSCLSMATASVQLQRTITALFTPKAPDQKETSSWRSLTISQHTLASPRCSFSPQSPRCSGTTPRPHQLRYLLQIPQLAPDSADEVPDSGASSAVAPDTYRSSKRAETQRMAPLTCMSNPTKGRAANDQRSVPGPETPRSHARGDSHATVYFALQKPCHRGLWHR